MSNMNNASSSQLGLFDALLAKLDTTEARVTRIRQSLHQALSDLETEQQCMNEIRTLVRAAAAKARMDDEEKDGGYVVIHNSATHDRNRAGVPEQTRTNRELKREPMKLERGDRHTTRPKYNRTLEHPNSVLSSARLSVKSPSKGKSSPSPKLGASSSSRISGGRKTVAAARPQVRGDGTQVPTHGQGAKLSIKRQISIQKPPRPPTGPFPFPDDIDLSSYPPDCKREGSDWFVLFNHSPKVKRTLDVNLVHALMHESVVCCVKFSQDGKWLVTGSNRNAQIYDIQTGVVTSTLYHEGSEGKDLYVRSVCFSPDGKFLATGAEDKKIRIWNIATKPNRIHHIFEGHQKEVYSIQFSAKGQFIVSGSEDQTARVWNIHDKTSKVFVIQDHYPSDFNYGIASVALSPDEKYVAVGKLTAVVIILDITTGTVVQRLRGHKDSVYSVAFTPDGKGLLSASLDRTLKYWDISGLRIGLGIGTVTELTTTLGNPSPCLMNFTGHKDYVISVAIAPNGAWVVSGSKDRGVLFWDVRTGVVQCLLSGHKNSVLQVDLSPVSNLLATAGGDWQARIWRYGVPGQEQL